MDLHRNKGKCKNTIKVHVPGLVTAKRHKIIISTALTAIKQNIFLVSALECNRHSNAFYFPLKDQLFSCISDKSTMNGYNQGRKDALCNKAVGSRYTFDSTVT